MDNLISEYKSEKNISNFKKLLDSFCDSFVDNNFTTEENTDSKYRVSNLENIKKKFKNSDPIIKLPKCNKCDNEEILKCKENELVNKYKLNNSSNIRTFFDINTNPDIRTFFDINANSDIHTFLKQRKEEINNNLNKLKKKLE